MHKIPGSLRAALFLVVIMVLALSLPALAQTADPPGQQAVLLTDAQGRYPLGYSLEILKDPQRTLTIEKVSSDRYSSQFFPTHELIPNYGFTDDAYWVRFHLKNNTRKTDRWLLEIGFANMHYADLYLPNTADGGWIVKQTGLLRPFKTRDIPDEHLVFAIPLPAGGEATYYMRFQNGASMTLPLTLWLPEAFFQANGQELLFFGFYYGALLMILVYNLFVWYTLRDAGHFYYVCFLASLLVWSLAYDGFSAYLFSNLYLFNIFLIRTFYALLLASMLAFTDTFLQVKRRNPRLHRLILYLLAGWGIALILTFTLSYFHLVLVIIPYGILSVAIAALAGAISWRAGFLPARYFLFSWLGFLVGAFLILLVREGIIPSSNFTENLFRFGTLWLAAFWSISLTDQLNLLKAETETANRALRASEHELSEILEGLPLAVVVYGKDRKPNYGNQRVYNILSNPARGIMPDLSAGRTLETALKYYSFKISGTDQPYPLEKFPVQVALLGEPASADDIEADLGDRRIPLEIWASPIRDDLGNVQSVVVAFQDIAERRQVEKELIRYRQELETLVKQRTGDLNEVNKKLGLRLGWISAVNDVHDTVTGTIGLAGVYARLCDDIQFLLGAELVFVHCWGGQGEQSDALSRSPSMNGPHDMSFVKGMFQEGSLLRGEIEKGKIVTYGQDQSVPLATLFAEFFPPHQIPAFVLAPIQLGQSVIGALGVAASVTTQNLILEESGLIQRMALDLAGLAQGTLLVDQTVLLATVEERNRLARELHDSVTQTLFTASVLAEATPHIMEKDAGIGRQNLAKLSRLIRGALAEMRSMLIELRMGDLHHQTLEQLLVTLADGARARSQAAISLSLPEDLPELPEKVVLCFYRVAREALHNASVHSGAASIQVALAVEGGMLGLLIQDDGSGFDPQDVPAGHLGLSIMEERANEIGAHFQIESRPGHGTKVSIAWPVRTGERIENDG